MTKADATAATRLLNAACRKAIDLIRAGEDCQPLLASAEVCAATLLEAS